jgi:50S ribosomal subunit-associated GTPase HflX
VEVEVLVDLHLLVEQVDLVAVEQDLGEQEQEQLEQLIQVEVVDQVELVQLAAQE